MKDFSCQSRVEYIFMNCEISEYVYEVVKGMGREDCRLYVSKSTVFFNTVYFSTCCIQRGR